MLGDISLATNIYIVTGYTDMRKSIDGLCAIVADYFNAEPNESSIYMFCGKRCDRIKVLLREHDGYVLLYKKLKDVHGRYRWPRNKSEVKAITWQQFDWLIGYSCAAGSSAIIRYYCYIPCTSTLLQATACHIFHTLYVLSFLICY